LINALTSLVRVCEGRMMSEEEFTNEAFANLSGLFSVYVFSLLPLDIEDLEENNNVASGAG
jgi:hypothetical protein